MSSEVIPSPLFKRKRQKAQEKIPKTSNIQMNPKQKKPKLKPKQTAKTNKQKKRFAKKRKQH